MLSVTWGRRYRTSVALEMWSYQALVQTTLLVPLRACALFLDSLFKATRCCETSNAHVRLHCSRCTWQPYCCYLQSLYSLGLRPIPFGPSLAVVCFTLKAAVKQPLHFAGSSLDCLTESGENAIGFRITWPPCAITVTSGAMTSLAVRFVYIDQHR
jgi:hypothetical protein